MSWIVKRKKPNMPVQWIYRWNEEGKRRERVIPNAKTKKQAEKIQLQWDWQIKVEQNVQEIQEPCTLLEAHQELMIQKDLSPSYEIEFRRYFEKSIFPFFGKEKKVTEISLGDIKRWIAWRKKH